MIGKALRLPKKSRAFLAEKLIESLDYEDEFAISTEWIEEIHRNLPFSCNRRLRYGIIYRFIDNQTQIIAIMHLHRKPGYWKSRIKNKS